MRLLTSVALLIASAGTLAAAQEQPVAAPNTVLGVVFASPRCERVDRITIDCSMLGTYPGKDANAVLTIQTVKARAIASDGTAFGANEFGGGGANKVLSQANVAFPKNIPIKLTFRFRDLPASLTTLRGLSFETVNYENIRIENQPKTVVDAVTTTALVALPKKTNTPVKFNIALSECVASGTNYTCTAKLSPAR